MSKPETIKIDDVELTDDDYEIVSDSKQPREQTTMTTDYGYRHIASSKAGQDTPTIASSGYSLFAIVCYDNKTWYFGLLNKSEYSDFLKWARADETFGHEIEEGASIELIDAEFNGVSAE